MKSDKIKAIASFLARIFIRVLNSVLILSLVLLTALFFAILSGISFELPQRICQKIEENLSQYDIRFAAESISLDMDGAIIVKNLKIGVESANQNLFDFRYAKLDFEMLSLIFGEFKFLALDLRGGKIYPSLGYENSGVLADCIDLTVSKKASFYKLENSNINIGKFGLILSGEISEKAFEKFANKKSKTQSDNSKIFSSSQFLKIFNDISKAVFDFQNELKYVSNPILVAEIGVDKNAQIKVRATAFLENLKQSVLDEQVKVDNIRIFASYDSSKSKDTFRLSAVSANLETSLGLVAKSTAMSGILDFKNFQIQDARALLINAQYKGVFAKYLGLYKKNLSEKNYTGNWLINAKIGDGIILANTEGSLKNFKLTFESELDCTEILKCTLIPKIEELKLFSFSAPILASGSGKFELQDKFFCDVNLNVFIKDSAFFGVDVKSVTGNLSYNSDSGSFWAKNVEVISKDGWKIGGDVYQNLKNFDYRFLLKGSLRPMAIAHFMEKWWTEVFSDFNFKNDNFPYADIVVSGQWGAPEYIYVFGYVNADNGIRNGVEFEKASLNVWVNPSHIAILNLYVSNENRVLTGALDWTYPEHKLTHYDINKVFVKSSLNKSELIAMGGERVKDVVKMLDFQEAPLLNLALFMPNPAVYKNPKDTANLDYYASGLTKAGKFNLQNLKFNAYAYGDDIEIYNTTFNFATGTGGGNLKLSKLDSKDCFSGQINLKDVNQYDFIETLQSLSQGDNQQVVDKKEPLEESYKNGRVSGNVNIEGFMDDAKTIKASGKVKLLNKSLAEIHIFGAISRAAAAMHIPLGSFDMTSATSDFEISDGSVGFPNLKIEGDAAIITGQARYNFIDDDITAKAIFAPFAAVKLPVFSQIMSLANPILSVVQISLSGKFGNPDVSLSLKPFNIFKNEANILRDMGKNLDKEIIEKIDKGL